MEREAGKNIIRRTEEMVRSELLGESTGHDWWHIHRVRSNALHIAVSEGGADLFVVEAAALLHDISDWKFNGGDDSASSRKAAEWLKSLQVDGETINAVCSAIDEVTFKGSGVKTVPGTLEGRIVQDADRLDAIGAIGIARAFAYGGKKDREIYNPEVKPSLHNSFDEYRKSKSHTINHFHEKLLLLRDLMNTDTGRRMAAGRHDFMVEYLGRFQKEWEGIL